jgi:hypothetical protein
MPTENRQTCLLAGTDCDSAGWSWITDLLMDEPDQPAETAPDPRPDTFPDLPPGARVIDDVVRRLAPYEEELERPDDQSADADEPAIYASPLDAMRTFAAPRTPKTRESAVDAADVSAWREMLDNLGGAIEVDPADPRRGAWDQFLDGAEAMIAGIERFVRVESDETPPDSGTTSR